MKIENSLDLKSEIQRLEIKSKEQKEALHNQFNETYESLKPGNILKNIATNITGSKKFSARILSAGSFIMPFATTLLSRKFLFGMSPGILKKVVGTILSIGVKKAISNRTRQIKNSTPNFFKRIINKFVA